MPPSKRKTRRKAAELHETSELDLPESSPSRPSPKKRKVNNGRSAPLRRTPPPTLKHEQEDSEEESETVSNSDLVDSVISYLQLAKEPVVATTEYSNEKAQPENKVSAYAKIAGRDWTYFVVDQAVNMGRPPDNNKDGSLLGGASSPIADMKEMLPVHIDLGPSKIVSRHHACIFYDADHPSGPGWYVRVNGRNGVKVNTALLKRGGVQQLKSGDILEIAGTQMMFVTPGDKVVVDPYFIERAKVLATGEEFNPVQHGHPDTAQRSIYASGSSYLTTTSRQQLAPAPPDFKRATTPPASLKDGRQSVFDSKPPVSPMYNRGMLMESTQEIDYSRDAAKDLKPPFSYATMIAQAIFSSDEEKLTLNNIYGWIQDKYAFYRLSNSGWQNSIRHNLSLNKAFQKVPRRTDEPGKGMKWQIAPEFREEYWKKQARRGVPASSSVPTSPASGAGKDINPNFRGPNGQNLGYDQTMVGTFPARDLLPIPPVPPHPASRNAYNSFPSSQHPPSEAFTPERRQRPDMQNTIQEPDFDDSPLPRKSFQPTPGRLPTYTLPSSVPPPQQSPANPTLSSSYLDTPFHSAHNVITPAPLRQNPRLAPPSTLVAPSKFMPDSSPAGGMGSFWKGIMSGDTPAHGLADMSPVKGNHASDGDMDGGRGIMSSSPPPMDGVGDGLSPSRPGRGSQAVTMGPSSATQASREEPNPKVRTTSGITGTAGGEDDDEGGMGGFDLARGFQPIGSFHSHSSQSHAHGHGHVNANAARASS